MEVRRGRPLGPVSVRVLQEVSASGRQTSASLALSLQLNRRHAANVCSELAAAGHLSVVERQGRANVYAMARSAIATPQASIFFLGLEQ